MNHSCLFWEKERLFPRHPSIRHCDKQKQRESGKEMERISNPESLLPFLLFKTTQVHRGPRNPYLIFMSSPALVAVKSEDKVDHRRKEPPSKDCRGQPAAQGAQRAGRNPGLNFPVIF